MFHAPAAACNGQTADAEAAQTHKAATDAGVMFFGGGESQERSGERISNGPHPPAAYENLWRGDAAER